MPNILVQPKRLESMELALVNKGFVEALSDYFVWVNDKSGQKSKGAMTQRYFLYNLEFDRLPKRPPSQTEQASLDILAKTVDGYRVSARQDPATYAKFWSNLNDAGKKKLLHLNMTPNSPAISYLKDAFDLKEITTASPEEFTPQGIKILENLNVDISQSPSSNSYEVISDVLGRTGYDVVVDEDARHADYIAAEEPFEPPSSEPGQPPEIPADPGDHRSGEKVKPEINEPGSEIEGRRK